MRSGTRYSTDARYPYDPMLGPLQYNAPDTTTQTQMPAYGSVVIDGANGQPYEVADGPGFVSPPANPITPATWWVCDAKDQRGSKRPHAVYGSDKVCDIGAVEY